jgi:hypothetical protein
MTILLNHLIEYTWITETGLRAWSVLLYKDNLINHRCGYVECKDPYAEGMNDMTVHGGITWQRDANTVYKFGVPTVGFDCTHAWDNSIEHPFRCEPDGYVRSLSYVVSECEKLAIQVHTLEQYSYSV